MSREKTESEIIELTSKLNTSLELFSTQPQEIVKSVVNIEKEVRNMFICFSINTNIIIIFQLLIKYCFIYICFSEKKIQFQIVFKDKSIHTENIVT